MAWGALEVGKTGRVISGAVVAAGRVTRGKGVGEGLAARGGGGARDVVGTEVGIGSGADEAEAEVGALEI